MTDNTSSGNAVTTSAAAEAVAATPAASANAAAATGTAASIGVTVEECSKSERDLFEDVCRELNMDKETEQKAWLKFSEVKQRYSLEGDSMQWICCALYAACRDTATPTVGGPDSIVMGNCVPLNNLLRSSKVSIYDFFHKSKQWGEMARLSQDFMNQILELERKFSITYNIYKRYNLIFDQLFQCPQNDKKNTKFSSVNKCTFSRLRELCWCLFVSAKNHKPTATVDLVTSFHLLICCIDMVYVNVLHEQRFDLINPEFKGVPPKCNTMDFDIDSLKEYCIIDELCQISDAIAVDAKTMKHGSWKTTIDTFFKKNIIFGNAQTFLELVSNQNIERNLKSLNSAYEQYVLSVGEFDERILASKQMPHTASCKESVAENEKYNDQHAHAEIRAPNTPYTRQQLLPNENFTEPVANATNNVRQLQAIAHITEPTDFVKQAGDGVILKINDILRHMSQIFIEKFPNRAEAPNRYQLAKSLYFYLLENILRAEIKAKPNIDLKRLLDQQTFNTTLMACCVELVLEAYNSQLKFPWILECFSISPFQFHKIIEIVVLRHDSKLTRALIKHLNSIEEQCLQSLAWESKSDVWKIIDQIAKPLPTWNEVDGNNMAAATLSKQRPPISPMINTAYETFNATPGPKTPPQAQTTLLSDKTKIAKDLFNTAPPKDVTVPMARDTPNHAGKPLDKRAGSLPIFLRKFFKLAWLRISKLCHELDMRDELTQKKIWTLFEHSITEKTKLMRDRHLDQILMCAIYIYIKVANLKDKQFADIMKQYRKQPQANSSIYREVLIETSADGKHSYNDIIHFYNQKYVKHMTQFSMKFSEKKEAMDLKLSPCPQGPLLEAKKVTDTVAVYVSPMPKNEIPQSPNELLYEFYKSPSKDLERMNQKVCGGKRMLPFNDEPPPSFRKRRLQNVSNINSNIAAMINDRSKQSNK